MIYLVLPIFIIILILGIYVQLNKGKVGEKAVSTNMTKATTMCWQDSQSRLPSRSLRRYANYRRRLRFLGRFYRFLGYLPAFTG